MAYEVWLLVMFVLVFPITVQGNEACYEDSWAYHNHTYTCFKLYQTELTWTAARDSCSQIQLGSSDGVVTRLAKIDDLDTDNFVRTLFPQNQNDVVSWIGLYKNSDNNEFRWDGFPDETPKYNATIWERQERPYVSTSSGGWKGKEGDKIRYYTCQQSARPFGDVTCGYDIEADGITITCTSPKIYVRAKCQWTHRYDDGSSFRARSSVDSSSHESHTGDPGGDPSYTTTCSFTVPNINVGTFIFKMAMYPDISGTSLSYWDNVLSVGRLNIEVVQPQKPTFSITPDETLTGPDVILVQGSDVVLNCSIKTGSPAVYSTTMSCESPIISGNNDVTRVSQSSSLTVGQVVRDMDGKRCTCWGNHITGNTETSTLTFKVITKPTSVSCHSNFHQTGLLVSCHIDKIYPQALAVWSYRQDNEQNFNSLPANECLHETYTDNDRFLYYQSNCSMSLTSDTMTFSPGNFTVQVTVNPNIGGIDEDTTSDAFITIQEIVTIVQPQKPTFSITPDETLTEPDVILVQGSYVVLTCSINTGSPAVFSTTMSCESPIISGNNDVTRVSQSSSLTIGQVRRDMDGKRCTCWGKHITGNTETSTLTFKVINLPDKPLFKVLNSTLEASSPIHFHENDTINITCEVQSGNPPVHSVTLSCEFSFKDSNVDYNHTVSGTAYVMDEIASSDMNGKNCTCIGNHLTGPIESSPLTFNITYPAEVTSLTVNGSASLVEVNVSDTLLLSCTGDGNPLPSVNIRKLEPRYVGTYAWQSNDSVGQVEAVFGAMCDHNGRYRCSVAAAEKDEEKYMTDVDIRVRCPPSYCDETSRNLKMAVRPGDTETVSFCVVAYPMPVFRLLKNSQTGWTTTITEDLGYNISHVTSFDSQQNVTINFEVLGPSHLGEYALDYSVGSGANSSRLYFQLTAALTHCEGEESLVLEVTLGQPATFNMCVTAFPTPSELVMEKANNESSWHIYNSTHVINMTVDFDTLTRVMVHFPKVKETDLGEYRLFESNVSNEWPISYLKFNLTESRVEARTGGGDSDNTGPIVGAVVAVVIVIIIVVVVVAFILRRKGNNKHRKTERPDTSEAKDTATSYGTEDYAKVDLSVKRNRAKNNGETVRENPIYDNDGLAANSEDTERPYSDVNVQNQNNTPDIKESDSNTVTGRDDLVYIQLDFNYTTDKKAKTQKKSKPKKSKKSKKRDEEEKDKEEDDKSDYASISATATIELRMEKENEERRKAEAENGSNEEKDGGEEETVYENMKAEDNVP